MNIIKLMESNAANSPSLRWPLVLNVKKGGMIKAILFFVGAACTFAYFAQQDAEYFYGVQPLWRFARHNIELFHATLWFLFSLIVFILVTVLLPNLLKLRGVLRVDDAGIDDSAAGYGLIKWEVIERIFLIPGGYPGFVGIKTSTDVELFSRLRIIDRLNYRLWHRTSGHQPVTINLVFYDISPNEFMVLIRSKYPNKIG